MELKLLQKWTDYLLKKHSQVHIKVSVENGSCCFHFGISENLLTEIRVLKPGKLEQLALFCLQCDWLKTGLDENNGAKPMEMFELVPQQYTVESWYSHVCPLSHSLCVG